MEGDRNNDEFINSFLLQISRRTVIVDGQLIPVTLAVVGSGPYYIHILSVQFCNNNFFAATNTREQIWRYASEYTVVA